MSHVRFRLQALVSARRAQRDQRRAELAAALGGDAQLRRRREVVVASLERHAARLRANAAAGSIDPESLRGANSYETALRAELAAIDQHQQAASAEIARRQDALAGAQRELDALEKLRDRRVRALQARQARRETRRLDEAAGRAHRQQAAR